MSTKLCCLILVVILLTGFCLAESSDCNNPDFISIGAIRGGGGVFNPMTTYWYAVHAQAGHSYTLFFFQFQNNGNQDNGFWSSITPFTPADGCSGTSTLTATVNTSWSPAQFQSNNNSISYRASFTAATAGDYRVRAVSSGVSPTPFAYGYAVIDTTMYNPRWSTFSGFITQWGLNNVSDNPITGVLTVVSSSGTVLAASTVTIQPGQVVFKSTVPSDLNIPANSAGNATFTHNGPPGAIQGDAYFINSNATVVVPSKLDTTTPQLN
jgi:hypothetical protein